MNTQFTMFDWVPRKAVVKVKRERKVKVQPIVPVLPAEIERKWSGNWTRGLLINGCFMQHLFRQPLNPIDA